MPVSANGDKKIIRNIRELPDWYELGKYRAADNLDAASWYEILLQRWNHFFWLNDNGDKKYKSDMHEGENPFYAALLQSRKAPLSLLTNDRQIFLIGGGQLAALKYDKKVFADFSHGISPFTVRQLYQNEHRLKSTVRIRIREYMDRISDSFGSDNWPSQQEHEWAKSFIDDPIFEAFKKQGEDKFSCNQERGHDLVQINLTVPDKILIRQFTSYLRQIRKRNPDIKPAKSYKAPEYKKWVEYGLLPYLDLKLWEIENNVSIPYRVLADAIFPDGNMGEEMIRKTTKKIANQVKSRDYIDFLATVAAQEIAEKI